MAVILSLKCLGKMTSSSVRWRTDDQIRLNQTREHKPKQKTIALDDLPHKVCNLKNSKPNLNSNFSARTLHAPPQPHNAKEFPLHGQTEPTPGRDQVREETHTARSPRESKRPIERTAGHKKN